MDRKHSVKLKPSSVLQPNSAVDIWILKLPLAGSEGSAASEVAPPWTRTITTRQYLNLQCACLQILLCLI